MSHTFCRRSGAGVIERLSCGHCVSTLLTHRRPPGEEGVGHTGRTHGSSDSPEPGPAPSGLSLGHAPQTLWEPLIQGESPGPRNVSEPQLCPELAMNLEQVL